MECAPSLSSARAEPCRAMKRAHAFGRSAASYRLAHANIGATRSSTGRCSSIRARSASLITFWDYNEDQGQHLSRRPPWLREIEHIVGLLRGLPGSWPAAAAPRRGSPPPRHPPAAAAPPPRQGRRNSGSSIYKLTTDEKMNSLCGSGAIGASLQQSLLLLNVAWP